LYIFFVITRYY